MFRNDPDLGAIPFIGDGTVDLAYRTKCGEAARFNGDLEALIAFIGDEQLVTAGGVLYRKMGDGTLAPLPKISEGVVAIRPPAGECFFVPENVLRTEYAIVVNLAPKVHTATTAGDVPAKKAPAVKKAPAKKAASAKK